jgi:hypothetical protein
VAGKKPKFYAVSLLDRKEVAISLGKLEKGTVLLKRTARVQVRNHNNSFIITIVFVNINSPFVSYNFYEQLWLI